VSLFLSGRPLWVNPQINASDAFVAAWLPGTEGGGIADVIFKAADGSIPYDFHGKLSFSWPRTPEQTAVNRGDRNKPLFAYGYGLTYRSNGNLRRLPENGGANRSTVTATQVFFTAGKPGAGWSWFESEDTHQRVIPNGVGVAGGVRMSATDRAVQEDARQILWSGKTTAAVGLSTGAPVNLQRETNAQLSLGFDYRVDQAAAARVTLRMACGPGCGSSVDLTGTFGSAPAGQWAHLTVPLHCLANGGMRMEAVNRAFEIDSTGQFGLSVANIRLESGTDVTSCLP
jgi:beta-glucosidase